MATTARRRRIEWAALTAAQVAVAVAIAWSAGVDAPLARESSPLADDTPAATVARCTPSSPPCAAAEAGEWLRRVEARVNEDLERGDWFAALGRLSDPLAAHHLRIARPLRVHELEDAILEGAASEDSVDEGLHAVFARCRELRDDPTCDLETRNRARRGIEWASGRALGAYGRDRREFSRAYRAVRFGAGHLDKRPDCPIRRFRFDEAAAELARRRECLTTWCYERRLLRKRDALRGLARDWARFVSELGEVARNEPEQPLEGLLDGEPGRRVFLDRSVAPDEGGFSIVIEEADGRRIRRIAWAEIPTARVAAAVVLPRLRSLRSSVVEGLARVYTELGDVAVASACLAEVDHRHKGGAPQLAPLRAELAALRELAAAWGRSIPADLRASPELMSWARRHHDTDVAHAIGGFGARDLGALDDDAVDAYVDGGILWAPEQWALVRGRLEAARATHRHGLDGWEAEAEHFTIFTDVSAEFAAQASLVLDAAYEQAALALGLRLPAARQRVVVYERREEYVRRFRNKSGGCWDGTEGTIHAFLDDPAECCFSDFDYPVLLHEAAHAALDMGLSHRAPSWMHEGLACHFERWNPARSIHANQIETGTSLPRGQRLRAALESGELPDLSTLVAIRSGWDVDGFGPRTLLRYALAESLFVHLLTDCARRPLVRRFLDEVAHGRDPAACLTPADLDALQKSWRGFLDAQLGTPAAATAGR